jgi:hypothetical protein
VKLRLQEMSKMILSYPAVSTAPPAALTGICQYRPEFVLIKGATEMRMLEDVYMTYALW